MRIGRFHTTAGKDPLAGLRCRVETGEDWQEYTVPQSWSRAAAEILITQVFCKEALPALTRKVQEDGVPEWLWRSEPDDKGLDNISAEWRYSYERDIRDVLRRVAGGLAYKAYRAGLFDGAEDARAFYDELQHIMVTQRALPETVLLATAGLDWAYGIVAKDFLPRQKISSFAADASGGVSVSLCSEEKDMFSRIKLLCETAALSGASKKVSVMLPVENACSAQFIGMKRQKDIDAAAAELGRKMLSQAVHHVMDAVDRSSLRGFDMAHNPALANAVEEARQSGVSENFIELAVDYARQGYESVDFSGEDEKSADMPAAVLSVPDSFIEAALTGHGFMLYEGEKPLRHVSASSLFEKTTESIWQTGDPSIFFRDTVLASAPFTGEAGQSVSGGYVFLQDTQAPSATIDLQAFFDVQKILKTEELQHTARMMVVVLEASMDDSSCRPLCLGVTNIAAFLMGHALPYDSEEGRAAASLATAIVSGAAHLASADMAAASSPFADYARFEKTVLQGVRDKIAFLSGTAYMQRGVARKTAQIKTGFFPHLAQAAKDVWDKAYLQGRENGFRHAHLSAVDTDADVQALLSAQTQDIVPEKTLVRFEGYFSDALEGAEIYGKKLNPSVPRALAKLGYSSSDMDDIHFYAVGHGTLFDAPHINHASLKYKGFHQAALDALEAALKTAHHIRYVFNKWTLGSDFCLHMLGFSEEEIDSGSFDMLAALGFSEDDIEEANLYCCGTMTLEGAPHLRPEHIGVFDCAAQLTPFCVRKVSPAAQVRMQAAIEPFLSGAVAHTIELDYHTSIDAVQKLLLLGWEQGVKHMRIYRNGSSLLHPVSLPTVEKPRTKSQKEVTHEKVHAKAVS